MKLILEQSSRRREPARLKLRRCLRIVFEMKDESFVHRYEVLMDTYCPHYLQLIWQNFILLKTKTIKIGQKKYLSNTPLNQRNPFNKNIAS